MIIDATATPVAAQGVIAKIREITDKPIKYVVLTHYHAVRVLGASGYKSEGLEQIIASRDTYDLIVERGQQDMDSEIGRFPRLFQAVGVPGLTWPTITFEGEMTLWLGKLEVKIKQVGRGHTTRATPLFTCPAKTSASPAIWSRPMLPATPAMPTWPTGRKTLDNLAAMQFDKLIPGRGPALMTPEAVQKAWPTRAISSAPCTKAPKRPWPRAWI